MKKVWTLIACFAACLSLAACGTDSNSSTPGSTVATTTTAKTEAADKTEKTTAATTAATKEQGSAAGMTLEAYIASIQDSIDQMSAATESSGMKMKVFARGKSLVYSYQYTIDLGDTSLLKSTFEQALASTESTFSSVLSAMKLVVPDAESVTVEYLDKAGKVIISKEFK